MRQPQQTRNIKPDNLQVSALLVPQQVEENYLAAAAVALILHVMKTVDKLATAALAIADDDTWENFACM